MTHWRRNAGGPNHSLSTPPGPIALTQHPNKAGGYQSSRFYNASLPFCDAWSLQRRYSQWRAYELNGQPVPIANGAPIRLRVERQLGYKMAKYIMRIELVESFEHIHGGQGGFWEDRNYEWYAGI